MIAQRLISGEGFSNGHHLASELVDCSHVQVKSALYEDNMRVLEDALASERSEFAISMRASLRRLVEGGFIAPRHAARHGVKKE